MMYENLIRVDNYVFNPLSGLHLFSLILLFERERFEKII